MANKKVIVIGCGFSGLSAACFLAKAGYDVTVLEKNPIAGGRASRFEHGGYTFDMGPSWYWMPDVFERFFSQFGKQVSEYYELIRLDPSYRIYWTDGVIDIPAGVDKLKLLFESIEPGSAHKLDSFLEEAAYKYRVGMQKLVFKPGRSILEFFDKELYTGLIRLDVFTSMKNHINKFFKDEKLRQIMAFPSLFLGAKADNTPALYSLMNYADMSLGTWYPKGGMYKIVESMHSLALTLGVQFHFATEAVGFRFSGRCIHSVLTNNGIFGADIVLGAADYHHVETRLIPDQLQSYTKRYWEKRKLAPSCLLYFVGVSKKLPQLLHHTLFFDASFETHSRAIYDEPVWPEKPLFYASCTSRTDDSCSPHGHENLFILIPVSVELSNDSEELREKYFSMVITRMEEKLREDIWPYIVYKRSYARTDFINDYNAFKGNAYGLANTLLQTAILKPSLKSRKVSNLYYAGQLTVPGPGVPPAIVSGEVAAKEVIRDFPSK